MTHTDAKRKALKQMDNSINLAALALSALMVVYCVVLTWAVMGTTVQPIHAKTVTQKAFWAGDHFASYEEIDNTPATAE